MVIRSDLTGVQFWRKPEPGEWGFEEDRTLLGGGGGAAATKFASENLIPEILAASRLTTSHLANVEEALKGVQEQIRDAIERETDPEKIRVLLGASESLALLTSSAPGPDLEKLLQAALHGHGLETAESAPAPEPEAKMIVPGAEPPSGQDAQFDLDALIGSSPAEQEAARDAEVILQVGEMVRSARIARGITQAELAAQTGMTQPHISEIERGLGRIGPTVVTLRRLLNALGDDLVIGPAAKDRPTQKRPSRRRTAGAG